MKKILTLFLSSLYIISFSQEYNDVVKLDMFGNPANAQNQMYINMMNRNMELKNIGKTSLYVDWQETTIIGKDSITLNIDSANYNYATDQFYFIHHNKLYYLETAKVKTVNIGEEQFRIFKYEFEKETYQGFLQILVDGDFPLLKRTYLKKKIVNDHPMKIAQANRTIFEKTTIFYYLNKKSGQAERLPKNKKKFVNLFRKRQAKLIRFAEENKTSTHDENDLIQFFEYNKLINNGNK